MSINAENWAGADRIYQSSEHQKEKRLESQAFVYNKPWRLPICSIGA